MRVGDFGDGTRHSYRVLSTTGPARFVPSPEFPTMGSGSFEEAAQREGHFHSLLETCDAPGRSRRAVPGTTP